MAVKTRRRTAAGHRRRQPRAAQYQAMVVTHGIYCNQDEYDHVHEVLAEMWGDRAATVPADMCRWIVDWILPDYMYPDLP